MFVRRADPGGPVQYEVQRVVHQRVLQSGQVLRGSHRLCRQGRRRPGEALRLDRQRHPQLHPTTPNCYNPAYNQSYTHGFDNRVESFESVQSIGGKGGSDAANSVRFGPGRPPGSREQLGPALQPHAGRRLRQHGAELQPREGRLQQHPGDGKKIAQTIDFVLRPEACGRI